LEACSAPPLAEGSEEPEALRTELLRKVANHEESCRTARFLSADRLASASADLFTCVSDVETGRRVWRGKLKAAGNSLLPLPDCSQFAVGDDDGSIAVYDVRQKKPTRRFSENSDFISGMALGVDGFSLCATSGDGTLAVYDLRKNDTKGLIAMSDFQEDELLSISIVKEGKKVICGSQEGNLLIFSWGDFGDQKDRIKGHPMSIDAMVPFTEHSVLTGSSDGKIRVVSIHQKEYGNCIVGSVGEHGVYPLEGLALSADRGLLVSVSHAEPAVKVWSLERAKKLLADFEAHGEGAAAKVEGSAGAEEGAAAPAAAEDSVDSDDSSQPASNKKQKKRKRTKGMAKRQAAKASKSAVGFFNGM